MKNKDLFDRTVAILVKAFQQETLRHCDCAACAVGNMVAANMGLKTHEYEPKFVVPGYVLRDPEWYDGFVGSETDPTHFSELAIKECESTGYSIPELVKIEAAFEGRGKFPLLNKEVDKDGFKGLMNVVEVLMTIHEATEAEVQSAKQLFVKVNA